MAKKEIAIVYMVAGLSSRFGGKIKQFAKVGPNGETLIEYSLKQAINAGFNKAIFIVGSKTEVPFKEMFGENYKNIKVQYALQNYNPEERDKPWGTVDALCSANLLINCPFVVCNGDDIYGENTFRTLAEHLRAQNDCATVGYFLNEVLPEKGATNRGIFNLENDYVKSLKEFFNIEKSNLAQSELNDNSLYSMNIFGLQPATIKELDKILAEFKMNNKNDRKIECLLPNEISKLVEKRLIRMKIYPARDKWFGVTNPEDEEIIRKQILELETGRK